MTQDRNPLWEAIESDSKAIARLFQEFGPSHNFGPEERLRFECLIRHRDELVAELQRQVVLQT